MMFCRMFRNTFEFLRWNLEASQGETPLPAPLRPRASEPEDAIEDAVEEP